MKLIATITEYNDLFNIHYVDGFLIGNEKFSSNVNVNFNSSQLIQAKNITSSSNKELHILVNKQFFDDDMGELKQYLTLLKELDVSYIYFSDFAVYMLATELNLENKLIFYHETMITNNFDINEYKQLNFGGVFLSKEFFSCDLKHYKKEDMIGILVHGYNKLYTSKRKIISNYLKVNNISETINSNTHYSLKEGTRSEFYRIKENEFTTIYNYEIIALLEHMPLLIANNIQIFLIDVIFEDTEYLNYICSLYYEALHKGKEYKNLEIVNKYQNKMHGTGNFIKKAGVFDE